MSAVLLATWFRTANRPKVNRPVSDWSVNTGWPGNSWPTSKTTVGRDPGTGRPTERIPGVSRLRDVMNEKRVSK